MWNCTDGCRQLDDNEADLVGGVIGLMVDDLVAEYREDNQQHRYQIQWFDQWDSEQRIWLMEQATVALLTASTPPEPSAMMEATIDAIFQEIYNLVRAELRLGGDDSWRQSVATICGFDYDPEQSTHPAADDALVGVNESLFWSRWICVIAERLTGPTTYDRAEKFRDGEFSRTVEFLQRRGVPDDFLDQIPPIRNASQTQASIQRIQSILEGS